MVGASGKVARRLLAKAGKMMKIVFGDQKHGNRYYIVADDWKKLYCMW